MIYQLTQTSYKLLVMWGDKKVGKNLLIIIILTSLISNAFIIYPCEKVEAGSYDGQDPRPCSTRTAHQNFQTQILLKEKHPKKCPRRREPTVQCQAQSRE